MLCPRHRRVYLESAGAMALCEISYLCEYAINIREENIGGLPYIVFEGELSAENIRLLSRLSFSYALFEIRSDLLKPIERDCGYFIHEDISSILKYSGKTSEIFTRLMLNLALTHYSTDNIKLLDPMAGKGTTLYEGLMQNSDVYGIEIDPKPAYESFVYIKKHLEMARYKHNSHQEKVSGIDSSGKKFSATRYTAQIADSKENMKSGQTITFEMIAGDTRHTRAFYKKGTFHAIVGDLPYGVQHGAKSKPQSQGQSRNAMGLLQEAMPGWMQVLKPGGAIVLAWNLFLIKREEMERLFIDNGLTVKDRGLDFSHRLDQATHRDLIVGVKPKIASLRLQ